MSFTLSDTLKNGEVIHDHQKKNLGGGGGEECYSAVYLFLKTVKSYMTTKKKIGRGGGGECYSAVYLLIALWLDE